MTMTMMNKKMYRVEYSHPDSINITQRKDFIANDWKEANELLNEHFKGMIIKEFRQLTWLTQGFPDRTEIRHIY